MPQDASKQRKKALKDAQRAVDAQLTREKGDYVPPDRTECVEKEWHQSLDDSGDIRVEIRVWRHEGRMVDFVLLVQIGDWSQDGSWEQVARVDCAGGRCHIHPPESPDEHQLIHRLDTVDDVEIAYRAANSIAMTVAAMIRDRRS